MNVVELGLQCLAAGGWFWFRSNAFGAWFGVGDVGVGWGMLVSWWRLASAGVVFGVARESFPAEARLAPSRVFN